MELKGFSLFFFALNQLSAGLRDYKIKLEKKIFPPSSLTDVFLQTLLLKHLVWEQIPETI